MPMDLPTMRTRVRRDLRDEDSSQYRWTDAVLDRHIARAVQEVSLAAPREANASLTTTAGSRYVSTTTLTARVVIETVEYPVTQYPTSYVPFTTWGDTLTLLVDGTPLEGEQVKVRYAQLHTLGATSTTLPDALHDLVATGAAAYAALEWSSYATNRVNVGGTETWRNYTTADAESSEGMRLWITPLRHRLAKGVEVVEVEATDGWGLLDASTAPRQRALGATHASGVLTALARHSGLRVVASGASTESTTSRSADCSTRCRTSRSCARSVRR